MNNLELLELAMNSLRYRSLRSWLAVLGIVIGVASIVSLISISTGMNQNIQKSLSGLGANIITITAGGSRAGSMGFGGGAPPGAPGATTSTTEKKITFNEAATLKLVSGVKAVDARVQGNGKVSFKNKNTTATIIGVEPSAFPESSVTSIAMGRTLGTGDLTSVVIGYSVMFDTFNDSNILNKQIKINGEPFRVVGVLNKSSTTFGGPDRNIFITQKAAKTLFNQTDKVSSVVVIAANESDPDTVAASVAAKLRSLHRVTNTTQDFTVTTASSTQSTISSVTDTLGLFLGGIASISLIVGGIGVANAMFTSVLEQTRYIGLLKALGARSSTILKLFLFEACMVGLIGGVLGIALSYLASAALASFGLPSAITLDLVLLGMGFSVAIGAVAGVIPARNAASVAPVEALKYE
ncbi:MAG: ABC transporter permease [Candidatus Micrarchaeia archaeon]